MSEPARRSSIEGGIEPRPGPGRAVRGGARSQLAGSALVAVAAASWGTWSLFLRPTHLPATVTTPIILLTARAQATDVAGGMAAGADDYVKKPFDLNVIVGYVKRLANDPSAGSPTASVVPPRA